ncbi:MAG: hypothetical protein LC623_05400 [Halobacteriales archaeon]|nr:hypothetical protein [Halobacteriales archaeon]
MTPWFVDPVRRCHHNAAACPGPETPEQNCGASIYRHIVFENPDATGLYDHFTGIIEVGPVQDDGQRRNALAEAVARALNEAKVVP